MHTFDAYKNDLDHHLQIHAGVRHYFCSECPKQFYTSSELKRHQFVMHSGTGRYECGVSRVSLQV